MLVVEAAKYVTLRPYYTMRWVYVLVTGTEYAIEKEPNASLKHRIGYITLAFACVLLAFCSLFARVLLALGRVLLALGRIWVALGRVG